MQRRKLFSKQSGAALITALLISAIVAALSIAILYQQQLRIRQTARIMSYDRATLAISQAEAEAVAWVANRYSDDLGLPAQFDLPAIRLPRSQADIHVVVQDQQGLYNVNNLFDHKNWSSFAVLLTNVVPHMSLEKAMRLVQAIAAYEQVTFGHTVDAERGRRVLTTLNELLLIPGMTNTIYQAIAPYLTALPTVTSININTAAAPVLATLYPTLNSSKLASLVECRQENGYFNNINEWHTICESPLSITSVGLPMVFYSNYYILRSAVTVDGQSFLLQSLLNITPPKDSGQSATYLVVWQTGL